MYDSYDDCDDDNDDGSAEPSLEDDHDDFETSDSSKYVIWGMPFEYWGSARSDYDASLSLHANPLSSWAKKKFAWINEENGK